MLDVLQTLVDNARALVGGLEPDDLAGVDARRAVELFVEMEKLAAAGKLLAVGRLDRTGAWVGDGSFRDLPAWLASIGGTTVGAARGTADTARRLRELPAATDTLRAGELSAVQADAVSAAAIADPGSEHDLLDHAKVAGVKGLKIECDRVIAAATRHEEEVERYERICAQRMLRHRRLADGSGCIDVRGPIDATAQIMAALEPFEQAIFERNRASGRAEHPDAVAFDALRQACSRDEAASPAPSTRTRGARPLATVVVHVSEQAFHRGWTQRGEICEIEGAGPVPVGVARRLSSDAFVKAIVSDGCDVTRVAHLGRTIPAHVRTAIEARDRTCVIAGCEMDRHLEIDHNVPVAVGGLTALVNLGRLCHHHHDEKTRRDLRRIGALGRQRLVTRAEYERSADSGRAPPDMSAP